MLRASTALADNPFRRFVLLILVYGKNISVMVCDRSGVREYPTINISGDIGLFEWVKLVVWLLFATPEQLGFFQGIGLLQKPTDCTVWIPKTDDDDVEAKLFEILGDPIVHITSDVINHRATVVFRAKEIIWEAEGNKLEKLGDMALVLKVINVCPIVLAANDNLTSNQVSWPHQVCTFEGTYLSAMEKKGVRNVARMVAGARFQNTDVNSRGFPMDKMAWSNSGLTSQGREQATFGSGSSRVTSVMSRPTKRKLDTPQEMTPTKKKKRGISHISAGKHHADITPPSLHPDDNVWTSEESELLPQGELKFTDDSKGSNRIYTQGIRILSLIVMPDYGSPLDSERHPDGRKITVRERVLACRNVINTIWEIYKIAVDDSPDNFPGMHRDISPGNVMIPSPGSSADHAASLIDFDFSAFCNKQKEHFSSGAPHRTGTRVSMAIMLLQKKEAPHHRVYFDMESVFWSLYAAILLPIPPVDGSERDFRQQINQICAEKQNVAGLLKDKAVQDKEWKASDDNVRKHGQKDVEIGWNLLGRMREYLFLDPDPNNRPKNHWQQSKIYFEFEQPPFSDINTPTVLLPWGDKSSVVVKVGEDLDRKFQDALQELDKLQDEQQSNTPSNMDS
jgi:hypothetical protein